MLRLRTAAVFEDEEGNEYNYVVVDYMFYNGDEYALLTEADAESSEDGDKQECIICRIGQTFHRFLFPVPPPLPQTHRSRAAL